MPRVLPLTWPFGFPPTLTCMYADTSPVPSVPSGLLCRVLAVSSLIA